VTTPSHLSVAERWLGPIAFDAAQPVLQVSIVRDDAAYDACNTGCAASKAMGPSQRSVTDR